MCAPAYSCSEGVKCCCKNPIHSLKAGVTNRLGAYASHSEPWYLDNNCQSGNTSTNCPERNTSCATKLQRRPSGSLFILSALCVLGVFLIVGKVQVFRQFGDSLMILAAVARALMITLTQKKPRAISVDMLQLTAIHSGVVGLGCWILALSSSKGAWPNWPHAADFWGNTFYLVVFCTIFAFFVQNCAVKQVGASRTALLMGSEPMFGVLFAAVYLGENLSMNAYFGGLLIVSVSIWVSLQRARP